MGLSIVFGVKYAKKGGETGGDVTLHRFFLKKTGKSFGGSEKSITFAPAIERDAFRIAEENAEIAQLVEHDLAKVGVAGPSPVFRSTR